jgi:hypothetical protein
MSASMGTRHRPQPSEITRPLLPACTWPCSGRVFAYGDRQTSGVKLHGSEPPETDHWAIIESGGNETHHLESGHGRTKIRATSNPDDSGLAAAVAVDRLRATSRHTQSQCPCGSQTPKDGRTGRQGIMGVVRTDAGIGACLGPFACRRGNGRCHLGLTQPPCRVQCRRGKDVTLMEETRC